MDETDEEEREDEEEDEDDVPEPPATEPELAGVVAAGSGTEVTAVAVSARFVPVTISAAAVFVPSFEAAKPAIAPAAAVAARRVAAVARRRRRSAASLAAIGRLVGSICFMTEHQVRSGK